MWLLKESRGMSDYPIQCVTYSQAGQNAIVSIWDLDKTCYQLRVAPTSCMATPHHLGTWV
jgi:hypothetical protein